MPEPRLRAGRPWAAGLLHADDDHDDDHVRSSDDVYVGDDRGNDDVQHRYDDVDRHDDCVYDAGDLDDRIGEPGHRECHCVGAGEAGEQRRPRGAGDPVAVEGRRPNRAACAVGRGVGELHRLIRRFRA